MRSIRPGPVALLLLTYGLAQGSAAESPSDVPSGRTATAAVDDFAWLQGTWQGTGLSGARVRETWSAAAGGQMVGHLEQLHTDGRVRFYEIMTLTKAGSSVQIRLKHFNADLTGWEEKAEVIVFHLQAVEPGAWNFDALELHRHANNQLTYVVKIQNRATGKTEDAVFQLARVTASP